jgi:hypothetical protein
MYQYAHLFVKRCSACGHIRTTLTIQPLKTPQQIRFPSPLYNSKSKIDTFFIGRNHHWTQSVDITIGTTNLYDL